jgi:hypothetical protein
MWARGVAATLTFVALLAGTASAAEEAIRHTPPHALPRGGALILDAEISLPGGVADASVLARTGSGRFTRFPMSETGRGLYRTVIPNAFFEGKEELEYYISVFDTGSLAEVTWSSERKPHQLLRNIPVRDARRFTIQVFPEDAVIDIDGSTVGIRSFDGLLHAGKHQIAVSRRGYQGREMAINMPRDRDLTFTVRLTPLSPTASVPASAPPTAPTDSTSVRPSESNVGNASLAVPPEAAQQQEADNRPEAAKQPQVVGSNKAAAPSDRAPALTPAQASGVEVLPRAPVAAANTTAAWAATPESGARSASQPGADHRRGSWRRSVGWTLLGIGGAALAGSIGTFVAAPRNGAHLSTVPQPGAQARAQLNAANAEGIATEALWAAGAACATSGAVIVLAF